MAASIVQSAHVHSGAGTATVTLGSSVAAGNILIVVQSRKNGAPTRIGYVGGDVHKDRPFTAFAGDVITGTTDPAGADHLSIGYRTATGDEKTLVFFDSWSSVTVYELANAAAPAGYEVRQKSDQAASTTKALAAWSVTGDIQISGHIWNAAAADQTHGTGYTQDYQVGTDYPGYLSQHSTAGNTASISGTSHTWAAMAVGITSAAAINAAFVGTPTSGAASLLVTFTDQSTGTPTSWSWDFGDTGTSTSQNPTHTYTSAGTYTVALTASKTGSSSTVTKVGYIVVDPVPAAGVYMDWDGDGFGTGSYDDVSSDVTGWDISRGAGAEVTGGADVGKATITLKDPDGLYNPYNASSPLYGKLLDGVAVWVAVNSDGVLTGADPRGLFAGRITDIVPIPAGGADVPPTVQVICEDPLGQYGRLPVYIDYAEGRDHATLRQQALFLAGEDAGRIALDAEIQTMPLSHADGELADVLAAINSINGTRHLIKPADNFTDWYAYTTRNRYWRLDGTIDSTLDAASEHVTAVDGFRLSSDTVTNRQRATVEPVVFTSGDTVVWTHDSLPFVLSTRNPVSLWVDFDDVVRDAVLNIASTGATVTSALTTYGATALVELSVASSTATISGLSIQGRLARRAPSESVVSDDTTSQSGARGVRAGADISGEYLGVRPEAAGIAEHVTWRYGNPQARPTLTVENWFPDMFDRDLYDTIGLTSTQLAVSGLIFEIVGLRHVVTVAAATAVHHTVTYVLQECRVQSDPGWFALDDAGSLLDDVAVLHH